MSVRDSRSLQPFELEIANRPVAVKCRHIILAGPGMIRIIVQKDLIKKHEQ